MHQIFAMVRRRVLMADKQTEKTKHHPRNNLHDTVESVTAFAAAPTEKMFLQITKQHALRTRHVGKIER